tara:strand:+ start:25196 stop:25651 length:456 start_codon:yes stop_codon:yes gene_type:complete
MPLVNRPYDTQMSDLVFHELDPTVGYTRECINVTPPAASAPVLMGTVVFRAKSADPAAPYAVLSAAAQLVLTNEFVVVFGDHYGVQSSFVPSTIAAGSFNAVGFKRGPVQLKDYLIKQIAQDADGANLSDAQFETLKEVLKVQDIIVEKTL